MCVCDTQRETDRQTDRQRDRRIERRGGGGGGGGGKTEIVMNRIKTIKNNETMYSD